MKKSVVLLEVTWASNFSTPVWQISRVQKSNNFCMSSILFKCQTQSMDSVWLSWIDFDWNSVWLGSIDHAKCIMCPKVTESH